MAGRPRLLVQQTPVTKGLQKGANRRGTANATAQIRSQDSVVRCDERVAAIRNVQTLSGYSESGPQAAVLYVSSRQPAWLAYAIHLPALEAQMFLIAKWQW